MIENLEYRIVELGSKDKARWDAFVESHQDGTFFHLAGWKNIIENTVHHRTHYFYCERDSEIVAVLPMAQVKSVLFGNALISVPFLVYGGVLSGDTRAEQLLVDTASRIARDEQVDYLELRNREPSERGWARSDAYVKFTKRLDPDTNKNLLAIPRKQRAMIRKGIKAGLNAEQDQDADRLYAALLPCKRNLGTPFFNKKYLQAIIDEFDDNAEITTVTKGSSTICSVMSFRFRNQILPYYGGGGELARNFKGNDFMYWAVMERACEQGVEIFDYGRSMVGSGAYRFKKHWGFEPEPLAYEYCLIKSKRLPNLNPSNPKYQRLIKAWRRLPLWMAGLAGPPIARRLG